MMHSPSQQTYYSTTQTNFFKAYAHQIQFIKRINQLLNSIEKRKTKKAIQQVKTCNKTFRKYLNERRIVNVKIEDVIEFQQRYQRGSVYLNGHVSTLSSNLQEFKKSQLPNISFSSNSKQQSRLSSLNIVYKSLMDRVKSTSLSFQEKQMIKKGFMSLLQKLQNIKKQQFLNEAKYLQGILRRQCGKLKEYGYDEQGFGVLKKKERNYNAKQSIVEQIQKQQKLNGLYPIIMKNVREQTLAIQKVEKVYELLMKS